MFFFSIAIANQYGCQRKIYLLQIFSARWRASDYSFNLRTKTCFDLRVKSDTFNTIEKINLENHIKAT